MINKIIKKIQTSRGFTLIETLLAVLLLATAIAGPLTIASKGLTSTLIAKNQFTAFYLAQDAMEQVRFLRDSACLAAGGSECPSGTWLSGLPNCVSTDGSATCYLDSLASNPTSPQSCGGTCPVMRYDTANGYFNYNADVNNLNLIDTPQQFIRTVKVVNDPNPSGPSPDEAVVTVTVSWSDNPTVTHSITVLENIFRWQ